MRNVIKHRIRAQSQGTPQTTPYMIHKGQTTHFTHVLCVLRVLHVVVTCVYHVGRGLRCTWLSVSVCWVFGVLCVVCCVGLCVWYAKVASVCVLCC